MNICPGCGDEFDTELGLGSHMTMKHKEDEELYEMGCDLMSGDNNPMAGRSHSGEFKEKRSERYTGREWSEERKESHKQSVPSGENHYRYGTTLGEDLKAKISRTTREAMKDEEVREKSSEGAKSLWESSPEEMRKKVIENLMSGGHPNEGGLSEDHKENLRGPRPSLQGDNNPATREDVKEKIRESWEEREADSWMCDWYDVGDLKVLGKLEKKVAESLIEHGVPEDQITVHDRSFNYEVDFVVGDIVIEAKGMIWGDCIEKGREFMKQFDEYMYVVVGQSEDTKKIPSDRWYSAEDMNEMAEWVSDKISEDF